MSEVVMKGVLPKWWDVLSLGSIAEIKGGKSFSKYQENNSSGVPYCKVSDMTSTGNEVEIFSSNLSVPSDKTRKNDITHSRSVIVPKRGGAILTNKKRLLPKGYVLDLNLMAFLPNTDLIRLEFLRLWFDTLDLSTIANGANVPQVNKKDFEYIPIPVPPLAEQEVIVEILDRAFGLIDGMIERVERQVALLEELWQSKLDSIFTQQDPLTAGEQWSEVRLGDVCEFVRGPFGGSLKKSSFVEVGYSVYEQRHPIHGEFSKFRYYIDANKFEEMRRFAVEPGDLLMSCSGTIGRTAVVPVGSPQGIINQALLKLRVNPSLSVHYLKLWLDSAAFQEQLIHLIEGAAIKNIVSVKVLKRVLMRMPSHRQQSHIVEIVEEFKGDVVEVQKMIESKLTHLRDLKQSLLERAFRGDLTAAWRAERGDS